MCVDRTWTVDWFLLVVSLTSIGLIVSCRVLAHPLTVSEEIVSKPKSDGSLNIESVSPSSNALSYPGCDLRRLCFGVQLRNDRINNLVQPRTDNAGITKFRARQGEY